MATPSLAAITPRVEEFRRNLCIAQTRAAARTASPDARDGRAVQIILKQETSRSLSAERQSSQREALIRTQLSQRGTHRIQGAVVTEQLLAGLAALHESHPNFGDAIAFVEREALLAQASGQQICGMKLLLSGPPGVGKTDFSLALADALHLPTDKIAMASSQSAAAISGSDTYWSNSEPGLVFLRLVQGDFANPLIVLDELDKTSRAIDAAGGANDPRAALYDLLEPRTAKHYRDRSVPWVELDARHINWIATANSLARIDAPILSRFTIIEIKRPGKAQSEALVHRLYRKLICDLGLEHEAPLLPAPRLVEELAAGNAREIQRALREALAKHLALRGPVTRH